MTEENTPDLDIQSEDQASEWSTPFRVSITPLENGQVNIGIEAFAEGVQAWQMAAALVRAADHLLINPDATAPTTDQVRAEQAEQATEQETAEA